MSFSKVDILADDNGFLTNDNDDLNKPFFNKSDIKDIVALYIDRSKVLFLDQLSEGETQFTVNFNKFTLALLSPYET